MSDAEQMWDVSHLGRSGVRIPQIIAEAIWLSLMHPKNISRMKNFKIEVIDIQYFIHSNGCRVACRLEPDPHQVL